MFNFQKIVSGLKQTVIITLITLVLIEISFRIYNAINPTFIFYDTSYNRYRGKGGAPDYDFHLNSKGFKDVEFNEKKADNTYRVIGIGDSFAYAVVPYPYAYLTLLKSILNPPQQHKKVEVINMGIPNLGPKDYLSVFVNEGLALKPDMVFLSFFVGNDFTDNYVQPNQKLRNLESYSYLASFIKYIIVILQKNKGNFVVGHTNYKDDEPSFTDDAYLKIEVERSQIYVTKSPFFEDAFNQALVHVRKIKEICDYNHIALVVGILPDEVQVNKALQAKVVDQLGKQFGFPPDRLDFSQPEKALAAEFQKDHIDYLDVLDDFVKAEQQKNLYKPNNTHWNIAGNKLAADLMGKHLLEKINH